MRGAVVYGRGDVRIEELPDPTIKAPTDALVRVVLACICGSDLWAYRGAEKLAEPFRGGHEFVGVVTDVGADVHLIRPGQLVIAPFLYSDGDCVNCRNGFPSSCMNGGGWGGPDEGGGQGEALRVPYADATLVAAPVDLEDPRLPALLTLSDVMGTGHHAAVSAGVGPGSTVAVIGDGAVGLCATLASRRLGAERIVVMSGHPERARLAVEFGATDIVAERGAEGVAAVRELTGGTGADQALECVGTDLSWRTAVDILRPGGVIGHVGVPAGVKEWIGPRDLFGRNIAIAGGLAPVRVYLPELLEDVLSGALDPSAVFDLEVDLEHVPDGYAAMDRRAAIKVLVRP